MSEYKLQILLPAQDRGEKRYIDSSYWNTVAESNSLAYLQQQADIMREYWKSVRIIQEEHVRINKKVVY